MLRRKLQIELSGDSGDATWAAVLTVALAACSVGSLVWTRETGEERTTLVVKRTYDLQPGLPMADAQEAIRSSENLGGLERPNDLVPYKAQVDCVVVGSNFSSATNDGAPFDLVLRRAKGQPKRLRVEPPSSLRRTSLGGLGRILRSAPSADADAFQAATIDQRLDELLAGDTLELRRQEEVSLSVALPTMPPGALLFGDSPEPRPLGLRFDTILVDGDQQVVTMTARTDFSVAIAGAFVVVTETPAINLLEVMRTLEAHPTAEPWLRAWSARHTLALDAHQRAARTTRRFEAEPTFSDEAAQLAREPAWLSTAITRAGAATSHAAGWVTPAAPSASPEQHATLVLEVPDNLLPEVVALPPPARVELAVPTPVRVEIAAPPPVRNAGPLRVDSSSVVAPAPFVAQEEDPREAQLPSYLKGRPKVEAPRTVNHDGLAALGGVAAASDAATESAARSDARLVPADAKETAKPDALDVLFIDERAVREAAPSIEAVIGEAPPTQSAPRDAARSWAQRPQVLDPKARARAALVGGHTTPLSKVGFRAQSTERAVIDADVIRVAGVFEPILSRLQILKTMVRVASLAITEESRAADLAALSRALDDDLEYAPEGAFSSLVERLERACDGEAGRPDTAAVKALAEATVRAKRGTSRSVLRDGTWVRGTLRDGAAQVPMYVPEAFERTLPNHARWNAVALVRPVISQDTRESSTMVLATIAMGRYVDPKSLVYRQGD